MVREMGLNIFDEVIGGFSLGWKECLGSGSLLQVQVQMQMQGVCSCGYALVFRGKKRDSTFLVGQLLEKFPGCLGSCGWGG